MGIIARDVQTLVDALGERLTGKTVYLVDHIMSIPRLSTYILKKPHHFDSILLNVLMDSEYISGKSKNANLSVYDLSVITNTRDSSMDTKQDFLFWNMEDAQRYFEARDAKGAPHRPHRPHRPDGTIHLGEKLETLDGDAFFGVHFFE